MVVIFGFSIGKIYNFLGITFTSVYHACYMTVQVDNDQKNAQSENDVIFKQFRHKAASQQWTKGFESRGIVPSV